MTQNDVPTADLVAAARLLSKEARRDKALRAVAGWMKEEAERRLTHRRGKVDVHGPKTPRTQADRVLEMIARARGASLEEMADKLHVLPKTVRSVISRESRRRGVQVAHVGDRYFAI